MGKQEELDAAKVEYKQALKRLENISERIHFAREQASVAKKRHLSRQKNSSLNSSSYKRKCSDASAISSHDDNCNSNSISTDDKPRVSTTSSGGIHILQNNNNSNRPTLHLDLQSHQLSNNSQENTNNFIIDPSHLEESQSVLEIALAKHRQRFGENQMVLSPTKNYIPEFYSEAHMNNDIHSDLKRRDSLKNLDQATDSNSNLTSRQGSSEINIHNSGLSGAVSEKADFSKNLNKLNQQMNHLNLGSTSTGISRTSGISSDMENYLMKERILDDNIKNIDNEKKVGTFQCHRSALSSGYGGSFKSSHNNGDDLESSPNGNGNLTRKGHHRNSSTGNKMG